MLKNENLLHTYNKFKILGPHQGHHKYSETIGTSLTRESWVNEDLQSVSFTVVRFKMSVALWTHILNQYLLTCHDSGT